MKIASWGCVWVMMLGLVGCAPPARIHEQRKTSLEQKGTHQTVQSPKIGYPKGSKTNDAKPEISDPIWQRAQQEVYRSSEELSAQAERELRRGQSLTKFTRGRSSEKLLALTFDDGPHPVMTERLLAVLKQLNVKATFFAIGKMIEKHPELLKKIDSAGHEVGNHTFSHVMLTKVPLSVIETEYKANQDMIRRTIGKTPRFCRPPGGDYDADVIDGANRAGLITVLWTDDPGDYASPGENVIKRKVLARLSKGGIILLHDGVQQTIDILPQLVRFAQSKGFRFVTVSELYERSLRKQGVGH